LITGIYRPSSGSIRLEGDEISGIAPHLLARRGVSRTFQNLQVCMNMSAIENVMIGAHLRLNSSLLAGMLRWPGLKSTDRIYRDKAATLLEFVGCAKFLDADANSMPFGALKRLEIARALAAEPRLLLLDEPAAGLNHTETHEIEELIRKLAKTGITIMLVEHDMKLVMGVSERILVLDYGKKLAEGAPDEVRSNRDVIAAYLGDEAQRL
jgi:branched-chain amino acid transport system ATP-binding protein